MKRLLLNQGLPRSTAALLAQDAWGVSHVSEIGMSRADDVDIVRRARAEARICVTLEADFHSLLATSSERGPSVIRIRKEGLDATALAALLQGIWAGIEDQWWRNGDGNRPLGESSAAAGRQDLICASPR